MCLQPGRGQRDIVEIFRVEQVHTESGHTSAKGSGLPEHEMSLAVHQCGGCSPAGSAQEVIRAELGRQVTGRAAVWRCIAASFMMDHLPVWSGQGRGRTVTSLLSSLLSLTQGSP